MRCHGGKSTWSECGRLRPQVHRDVYLPAGQWRDYKTGTLVEGGRWVRDYKAPLDTLPMFVNVKASTSLAGIFQNLEE
jgi:alpha-glucosidase (family GH31 glycosyl hydrolase)